MRLCLVAAAVVLGGCAGPAPQPPQAQAEPRSCENVTMNPRLFYPPEAKERGQQGRVIVRVLINADGTAGDVAVAQSSGHRLLDLAAMEYLKKACFIPGKRSGQPQAMWYRAPVNFVLE